MFSDPGFRAARRAGAHGLGRVLLPLVFLGALVLVIGGAPGAVSLTLRGEAVAKQRTEAGRPMRTVLVRHREGRTTSTCCSPRMPRPTPWGRDR